jgi:hypothetical protein
VLLVFRHFLQDGLPNAPAWHAHGQWGPREPWPLSQKSVVQGLVPSELSPPLQIAHGLARARVRRRKNARHGPLIKELLTATTLDTS